MRTGASAARPIRTCSVAHLIVGGSGTGAGRETQAETDRRAFLGRGRRLWEAAAFDEGARLTGNDGFTLDPVFALRRVVRVPAGKKASLIFWTIAAPSRGGGGDGSRALPLRRELPA